jgi:hypothetical protein
MDIWQSRLKFLFQSLGYALGQVEYIAAEKDAHPELAMNTSRRSRRESAAERPAPRREPRSRVAVL